MLPERAGYTTRRRSSGQVRFWALAALGGLAIFAALQRQMIYHPAVATEDELTRVAAASGLAVWRDAGGQLIGWRAQAQGNPTRRVIVFHGNAGLALQREYFAAGFGALGEGWEVYLFEYPGYGSRPGTPSESTLKEAATAALALLLERDPAPVYLAGESLGSGVASYLAGTFPDRVAGLLLVTPFSSLTDVAAHHFGFLPVRSLLRERYDSVEALSHYRGPAAFLLAGDDEVVPTELGQRLHDSYGGPKWLRVMTGAGHNTLPLHPSADWWGDVSAFLLSSR